MRAALRNWFETQLGLSPWVVVMIAYPLLIVVAVFLLREVVLRYMLRDETRRERLQLWRRVSLWAGMLVSVVAVGVVWRTSGIDWIGSHLQGRFEGDFETYAQGAIYAVVATAILLLALLMIRQLSGTFDRWLASWMAAGDEIRFQQAALISKRGIVRMVRPAVRATRWLLVLGAFYVYVPLLLSFFPETVPFAERLMPYVRGPIVGVVTAIVGYLPKLLTLVVIVLVARGLMRLLQTALKAVEKQEIVLPGFDSDWADPTFRLVRILVVLVTVVVIYPYLPGAGSQIFKGFSVFVGAMFTLGSSAAVNNLISGAVLTYSRSYQTGDRIKVGDTVGEVVQRGMFVTRMRVATNEIVTIPNGVVLSDRVNNISSAAKHEGLAVFVSAGIGYDVDWRKVHAMMTEAALATPGVEREPAPRVLQTDLGDFAVTYALVAWTSQPKQQVLFASDLRKSLLDVFNREGIEIMTPSVTALRDANSPAIPAEYDPPRFSIPGLQFLSADRKI